MSVDSGGFQRPVNPVLAKPCSHTGRTWPGYLISMREPDFTRKPDRLFCDNRREPGQDAGWSSLVARQAHNLKVAGSNPAPATTQAPENIDVFGGFSIPRPVLNSLRQHMVNTGVRAGNPLAPGVACDYLVIEGLGIARSTEGSWSFRGPSVFPDGGSQGRHCSPASLWRTMSNARFGWSGRRRESAMGLALRSASCRPTEYAALGTNTGWKSNRL